MKSNKKFDVIVVGGGHAGVEAGRAGAGFGGDAFGDIFGEVFGDIFGGSLRVGGISFSVAFA